MITLLGVQVPRSRFLPVKNTQDLLAIMSNLYEVTEIFSLELTRKDKAPAIELSRHFSKISEFRKCFGDIPRLRQLKRLKVEGDIYFGSHVVLKVSSSSVVCCLFSLTCSVYERQC